MQGKGTRDVKHKSMRFSLDKNIILQIRISITRNLQISRNVMPSVQSLVKITKKAHENHFETPRFTSNHHNQNCIQFRQKY